MKKLTIYLASSWKNQRYPEVLQALRAAGHDVYDFRHQGFSWSSVDPGWRQWSPAQFCDALKTDTAKKGFATDMNALIEADVVVLLMPCGRSAHLELGFACGAGKVALVLQEEPAEAELMYGMTDGICTSLADLLLVLGLTDVANSNFDKEDMSCEG
jgi:nucleoside 2-deoxyribosyltransferase